MRVPVFGLCGNVCPAQGRTWRAFSKAEGVIDLGGGAIDLPCGDERPNLARWAEAQDSEKCRERPRIVRFVLRQPGVNAGPNTACGGKRGVNAPGCSASGRCRSERRARDAAWNPAASLRQRASVPNGDTQPSGMRGDLRKMQTGTKARSPGPRISAGLYAHSSVEMGGPVFTPRLHAANVSWRSGWTT